MSDLSQTLCLWITPKVFDNFDAPFPTVISFYDHYANWIEIFDQLVINFCTGNGDHILCYSGKDGWESSFDWARYNYYIDSDDASRRKHNLKWLEKVREGGLTSGNPCWSGPSFILSEQILNYHKLYKIYNAFKEEAYRRNIKLKIMEYLEPGPEFCQCEWKDIRHPEAVQGRALNKWHMLDVCSILKSDNYNYAAYPGGIPENLSTSTFISEQARSFIDDMKLDGIFLGNQFGLNGLWFPENAPEPTAERRNGIKVFFHELRKELKNSLIYWMDTYSPMQIEMDAWAMSEENYKQLDAVIVSNFAVIVERTKIGPNLESRIEFNSRFGRPATLFSFDFVDPWYAYRSYLDHRPTVMYQHAMYAKYGRQCQGITFFANDTFGHWVLPTGLDETFDVVKTTLKK